MTKEEAKNILYSRINNEIKDGGGLIFNNIDIELVITRILEPYEKSANLPLPDFIKLNETTIDKTGITRGQELIEWSEICVSGIKTTKTLDDSGDNFIIKKHLMICLNSGRVIHFSLGDISYLKGLLGHYIELYKVGKSVI